MPFAWQSSGGPTTLRDFTGAIRSQQLFIYEAFLHLSVLTAAA